MKIVVTYDGVVSLYTMTKNIEMLTEEVGIKNVQIEECEVNKIKSKRADLFVAADKDKEFLENADGLVILLNNPMDKQELVLKLLEAFNKLNILEEE